MAKFKRKQVYLDVSQERRIKRWAQIEGVAEAEVIRRTIELGVERLAAGGADRSEGAVQEFFAGIDRLIEAGPVPGTRTWRRDDLYDRGGGQ